VAIDLVMEAARVYDPLLSDEEGRRVQLTVDSVAYSYNICTAYFSSSDSSCHCVRFQHFQMHSFFVAKHTH